MSMQDLIALLPGEGPLDVPPELGVVTALGWRAVLAGRQSPLRQALNSRRMPSRKHLLQAARQRQFWLETLLPQGTVLPALAGTRIKSEELAMLVQANSVALARLVPKLEGQVQFQVTIRCDAARAAQIMAKRPGPFAGRTSPKAWVGAFDAHVVEVLQQIQDLHLQALPAQGDLVANYAVLLPADKERAFDAALESIDALWPEGLSIRQVGPSPGVSFASFGIKRIPAKALKAAARMLSVHHDASQAEVDSARRAALKHGNAAAQDVRDAADLLISAAQLATPGPFPQLFTWAEGQSLPAHLSARSGAA